MRGFIAMRILAANWNDEPQRASRPFSKDRGGFVIAEGAWFFVLEERERAVERGAKILGEIVGYGSTCDAYHRVRLEECGEEPARAIALAMKEAGVAPEAVGYLNYHGTSTELNDRIETRAVKLAFGKRAATLPGSGIDRTSARRVRSGRSRGDLARDARRRAAADHESGRRRSGVRSGLCSRTRPSR